MPIIEIDKSVLEEIADVIEQRDKMYENQIATTKKLTDGIEKVYEQEVKKLRNQLQQKENIIKEVREWAKKYSCQFTNDDGELVVSEISFNIQARPCDLFKILDKAGDSNERNKDNK